MPSLLEQLVGAITRPSNQALYEQLARQARTTPILAGEVPTPLNLGGFVQKMAKAAGGADDLFSLAKAYMKTRYPMRQAATAADTTMVPARSLGLRTGEFDVGRVGLGDAIKVGERAEYPNMSRLKEIVETLAHEQQHYLDFARAPKTKGITKGDFLEASDALFNRIEGRAYKAGGTAAQGFNNFLRMLQQATGQQAPTVPGNFYDTLVRSVLKKGL